jgi:hypothetical protein
VPERPTGVAVGGGGGDAHTLFILSRHSLYSASTQWNVP